MGIQTSLKVQCMLKKTSFSLMTKNLVSFENPLQKSISEAWVDLPLPERSDGSRIEYHITGVGTLESEKFSTPQNATWNIGDTIILQLKRKPDDDLPLFRNEVLFEDTRNQIPMEVQKAWKTALDRMYKEIPIGETY